MPPYRGIFFLGLSGIIVSFEMVIKPIFNTLGKVFLRLWFYNGMRFIFIDQQLYLFFKAPKGQVHGFTLVPV